MPRSSGKREMQDGRCRTDEITPRHQKPPGESGDRSLEMQDGDAGQTKLPHVIKSRRESQATGVWPVQLNSHLHGLYNTT